MDTIWPYLHPGTPPLVEIPVQWLLDDGPFFAYGLRPPLYRQIFPPGAALAAWRDEFRAMHKLGGAYTLILHPQYVGRPSRVEMLQKLVDDMRSAGRVWFTHGAELARHVVSESARAPMDGRPILERAPASRRRAAKKSRVRGGIPRRGSR
jgi:peptidoglycan/xylan/chitin deacetylase (PgdA/CDA1 family)